ncbi:MAG: bifunctional precorrin-2 dehydrogenase/sirohydrochlorin ferrochelatase, partial [Gammaproteobacteria bacterium]
MKLLPLFLNIKNKPCLVVGAGPVAARKVELLLKAGASVRVVAKNIGEAMSLLQQQSNIE